MLDVVDLHASYGKSAVLHGMTLHVPRGKLVAVLGRNGVGKTTLVRSIAGLTEPRQGQVIFDGKDVTGQPPHQIARLGMAVMAQGRRVFPSLTVRENLDIGRRAADRGRDGGGIRWSLEDVFAELPVLRERLSIKAERLSGGEQQMLAFARILLRGPRLVLMDEPSEGLSPLRVRELHRIVARLRDTGMTFLLVEQNLPFALDLADHVYLMAKGAVVHESDPESLRADEGVLQRFLSV
ncbi:MAG: ATP-binding cassette domain-containing protein [Streptosporangiales bacterium]|nr:ATP-binding cassette domain-containing protein [Streptosporangiales bacterium]